MNRLMRWAVPDRALRWGVLTHVPAGYVRIGHILGRIVAQRGALTTVEIELHLSLKQWHEGNAS
jgi:hypothetical protein